MAHCHQQKLGIRYVDMEVDMILADVCKDSFHKSSHVYVGIDG